MTHPKWLQTLSGLMAAVVFVAACGAPPPPVSTATLEATLAPPVTVTLEATATVLSAASATAAFRPLRNLPLPAGTYTSEVFETPLNYTVPTGWMMFEDEPGQFGLAQVALNGPCLCVWRDVRAAAVSCAEAPEPGVGSSAADLAAWLAARAGLDTTEPEAVSIGGLAGYVVDVKMDPSWTGDCPFSNGQPTVPLFVGTELSAGLHWGTDASSAQRYYLLDLGEAGTKGNIVIAVEVCCGAYWETRMAAAVPVIESFVFDVGGSAP